MISYAEAIYKTFDIITGYNDPLFIDVGCDLGNFPLHVIPAALRSRLEARGSLIGIDPQNYPKQYNYKHYIQKAVSTIEGERTFYLNADMACSSLLPMNVEMISHDYAQKDTHWFVARHVQTISPSTIQCTRLDTVINSLYPGGRDLVHFIACDAEGMDEDCILSLGDYLPKTLFFQIETSIHPNGVHIFKGQKSGAENIKTFQALGFEVLSLIDYSQGASPQADIIFYNTCYYNEALEAKV